MEEVERVVLQYHNEGLSSRQIAPLVNRSSSTVRRILRKHGLTKYRFWTREETEFLIKNYGLLTAEEIAEKLGRTTRAVHAMAGKLRLMKIKKWTDKEKQFLKTHYGIMDLDEIAKALGRSYNAVWHKVSELGLNKLPRVPLKLSETEKAYIAGILDGEGSISAIRITCKSGGYGYGISLVICSNVCWRLIEYLKNKIPSARVSTYEPKNVNYKTRWSVYISNSPDMLQLLELLYPYLIVKKEQAKLAIEFLRSRLSKPKYRPYTSREISLWKKIREENSKLRGRGNRR